MTIEKLLPFTIESNFYRVRYLEIVHKCIGLAHDVTAEQEYITNDEALINEDISWNCTFSSDCSVPSSSCINGICQCPVGHIYSSNMTVCLKVATTYGEKCEESIQCSRYLFSGGICMNTICVCSPGYYYMHGRCNAYAGLLEKCRNDDDCYVIGDFSAASCVKGTCKCTSGYYQREYRSCRPEAKKIGDKCTIDYDCKRFNTSAICINNNTCQEDTSILLYSNDISEKIKPVPFSMDTDCTKNADCKDLENAFCGVEGKCICNRAHFFNQDTGKCAPELGEPCREGDTSVIDNSECRNGVWSCGLDKVVSADNRRCEKVTKRYNDTCLNDLRCFAFGPDAVCRNGGCICNENSRYIESEQFCWMKKGIGESCQRDRDCFVDGLNANLSCTQNLCSCPNGTHPNSLQTACVADIGEIGSKCEVDGDCTTVNNTICRNGVCACEDNYYESKKKCLPGIKSNCTKNSDCILKHSICSSNTCVCDVGYVAASVNACMSERENNMQQSVGKTFIRENYLYFVSFGEHCEKDIQCYSLVPNSICLTALNSTTNTTIKSTCSCDKDHHYNFGKCFKRKVLGMDCKNLGECYLDSSDGAVCKNGVCACDWDYFRVNNTVCKKTRKLYDFNGSNIRSTARGLLPVLLLLISFYYS
ncbi:uncharacterized protein LOC143424032 [Xylocopa sonorina]|uniref:uncharacterized protein LOC143424032 n=1 Tax=Xylocopa sonorina TaxID=1818115 RepID=UPI00403B1B10